ncbi:hypothetical protein R3P38DRAFT_1959894 [Favolaschia claudopus]|uniref:Uncharacterized protein n=1 Tax=Favolaschia claudopus TaxID=2862362 RepID=A0AAV9ZZS7_9AGAR
MPASFFNPPWPEPTDELSLLPGAHHASSSKIARQDVADQATVEAAKTQCQIFSGNEVLSCFPTGNTVVTQHQWADFVWNSNNPDFTQTDRVDVYLFHGDSLEQVLMMPNQVNPRGQAGVVSQQVNDTWWGTRGVDWNGSNISYPFYWLIARHGESLDDGRPKPQATFSAIQTTFADSVLATMSSTSRESTQTDTTTSPTSSAGVVLTTTISGTATTITVPATPNHNIQDNSGHSSFPTWAIVLTVLGIVLVVAILALMVYAILYLRSRDKRERYQVRSSTPDMAAADSAAPAVAVAGGGLARDTSGTSHGHDRTTSPQRTTSPDSTQSHPEVRPFSGSDAAIMANAFRAQLRQTSGQPLDEEDDDDMDREREGEHDIATPMRAQSPERPDAERERETLLRRGLSEGTDIRSVDSIRGVRVESSSDGHGRTSAASPPPNRVSL